MKNNQEQKRERKKTNEIVYVAFARVAARLPTWAWKPVLIPETKYRDRQFLHNSTERRSSFCNSVSGERQVLQITYSSTQTKTNDNHLEIQHQFSYWYMIGVHFRFVSVENVLW